MTAVHAARSGAALLRVHDVRATRQAIDWSLLLERRG
jgi:dihydropteroate synthase